MATAFRRSSTGAPAAAPPPRLLLLLLVPALLVPAGRSERLAVARPLAQRGGPTALARPRAARRLRRQVALYLAAVGGRAKAEDFELYGILDVNGDGFIDKSEFLRGARRSSFAEGGHLDSQMLAWYEQLWAASDVDQDGCLNSHEAVHMERLIRHSMMSTNLDAVRRDTQRLRRGTDQWDGSAGEGGLVLELVFDAGQNGYVDKQGILNGINSISGREAWEEAERAGVVAWIEDALDRADANGDGRLNLTEFREASRQIQEAMVSSVFARMHLVSVLFDGLDLNEDGLIAKHELNEVMDGVEQSGGSGATKRMLERLRRNFGAADFDMDGHLDREETMLLAERFVAGDEV